MIRVGLSVFLFASMAMAGAPSKRSYMTSVDNLNLIPAALRPVAIASEGGLVIVQMTKSQLEEMSKQLHEKKGTCAGMIDVEADIKTKAPREILRAEIKLLQEEKPPVEKYEIKYKEVTADTVKKASIVRFETFLKELTSFPNRYADGPEGVKAANWLRQRAEEFAKAAGRDDVVTELIATPSYDQPSVVVKILGKTKGLPGVVLGGHMDTYQGNRPGADDDGSGTAGVMEVYRAILDNGIKPNRDLYFMFYAAEEWGLHGSAAVVRQFVSQKIPIRAAVQLDMIGYPTGTNDGPIHFILDNTTPEMTTFGEKLLAAFQPGVKFAYERCGYACSDHASWYRSGIPVAFPFEATMKSYNKRLHTESDTVAYLNMEHAMKHVRLATSYMVELADPIP